MDPEWVQHHQGGDSIGRLFGSPLRPSRSASSPRSRSSSPASTPPRRSLDRSRRNLERFREGAIRSAFEGEWPWTTLGAELAGGVTKDSKRQADAGVHGGAIPPGSERAARLPGSLGSHHDSCAAREGEGSGPRAWGRALQRRRRPRQARPGMGFGTARFRDVSTRTTSFVLVSPAPSTRSSFPGTGTRSASNGSMTTGSRPRILPPSTRRRSARSRSLRRPSTSSGGSSRSWSTSCRPRSRCASRRSRARV